MSSTSRKLSLEDIGKKTKAMQDKGVKDGAQHYFSAANPSNSRKFTGAIQASAKEPGIVYFPDYNVFGTPQQIVDLFRNAGQSKIQLAGNLLNILGEGDAAGEYSLSSGLIARNSFDARKEAHADYIRSLIHKKTPSARGEKKTEYSFEEYVALGRSAANSVGYRVPKTVVESEGAQKTPRSSKAKAKSSKSPRNSPVDTFNLLMDDSSRGNLKKVIDTRKYQSAKKTGAVQKNAAANPKTPYPRIVINGKEVVVPIIAESGSALNDYINDIIGQSRYADYAADIRRAVGGGSPSGAGGALRPTRMATPPARVSPKAKTPSPVTSPRSVVRPSASTVGRAMATPRAPSPSSPKAASVRSVASLGRTSQLPNLGGLGGELNADELDALLAEAGEM